MAHIIAHSADGPRGNAQAGSDSYDNLILLCPTCHTIVDKDPVGHPKELLLNWKNDHEKQIREKGASLKFNNISDLKREVTGILQENFRIWNNFGPQSEIASVDPASNASEIWRLRKLDTVIPNNAKIINVVENNRNLLSREQSEIFLAFKDHAHAFEQNQYGKLDHYPTFPINFQKEFTS